MAKRENESYNEWARRRARRAELAGAIATVAFCAAIACFVYTYHSLSCHWQYNDIGETSYGFFSGCRVKYNDAFIPAQNLRIGDM